MLSNVRRFYKCAIVCTILCLMLVGCSENENKLEEEKQSTVNESLDNQTIGKESEIKESTTEEPTTEESTTEVIPDDGLRDKLVAAAKLARDEYVSTYEQNNGYELFNECVAFYDLNLDGVPEFCTLEPNAIGILSGYAYVYQDGRYVQLTNIVSFNQLSTYKDQNGNSRSKEISYNYTQNENGEDVKQNEVYIYDYKENVSTYIAMYEENMGTNEISYYNDANESITKEQYDEIVNNYFEGYLLVENCGGKYQSVVDDAIQSIFDAYVSYLKKIGK